MNQCWFYFILFVNIILQFWHDIFYLLINYSYLTIWIVFRSPKINEYWIPLFSSIYWNSRVSSNLNSATQHYMCWYIKCIWLASNMVSWTSSLMLVQEPVKNYSVMESLNFQFCCSGRKCLEGFTSIINSPRYLMNTGIDLILSWEHMNRKAFANTFPNLLSVKYCIALVARLITSSV